MNIESVLKLFTLSYCISDYEKEAIALPLKDGYNLAGGQNARNDETSIHFYGCDITRHIFMPQPAAAQRGSCPGFGMDLR